METKYVLITTAHRGVFFGRLIADEAPASVTLAEARNAIYFGTTKGFLQLAETGPTSSSRIGSPVSELRLFDITSITVVSEEAQKAWKKK